MSVPERRAVLSGIAFGDDPRVTPGDRVRALAALRELERDVPCSRCASFEPPEDPERAWDFIDDWVESLILWLGKHGESQMPRAVARLRLVVEREAADRARVIADASRIEAEVERRAEELAEAKYRSRSFGLVSSSGGSEVVVPGEVPSGPRLVATNKEACPETASRPDTSLGWSARRESGIRRLGRR